MRTLIVLGVILAGEFSAATQTHAQTYPDLSGRVVDTANLLPATTEQSLVNKLAAHETKTGQQVVVATIGSLQGREIDGYANGLFRQWGLGDKERNDGVLFLIAKEDRKLRIEVGYGLEATLTDALSAYIIRTAVVPAFKKGRFTAGITNGTDRILDVLVSDEAELEAWQGRARKNKSSGKGLDWPVMIFFGIWVLFIIGVPLLNAMIRKFGKKLGPNHYRWLGMDAHAPVTRGTNRANNSGWGGGWTSGGGGWSSGGGGFGGGGGSSGGGGASGGW